MLQVPSLDDLLEPLIGQKHGPKAVMFWGKGRHLYSQPLKAMENLAYLGQNASRMGIISMAYIQQALGKLLQGLKEDTPNMDGAVQTVRDIFLHVFKKH